MKKENPYSYAYEQMQKHVDEMQNTFEKTGEYGEKVGAAIIDMSAIIEKQEKSNIKEEKRSKIGLVVGTLTLIATIIGLLLQLYSISIQLHKEKVEDSSAYSVYSSQSPGIS